MSSSYPPPPPSTTDGNALLPDTAQQGPDAHAYTGHPQFITDAAAAAVAAAHHGLQALQAAVAAPAPVPSPSPVTPHHAPLPDASSLASAGTSLGPSNALSPHNPKATRLRRACDMCSQRKVKVCPPLMRSLFGRYELKFVLSAVRRDATMQSLPRIGRRLHVQSLHEATRPSKQAC
jgi:hypothetical protein